MNRKEAVQLVAVMSAAYPTAKVQDETAVAYHLLLSDVPYDAAIRAFTVLGRTSKWMPTPAEIREVLTDAISGIEPWEAAWDELIRTIDRFGNYRHHPSMQWGGWSDELVEAAVNHVGYEHVCGADYEQLPTIRAQFRNAYQNEANRRKRVMQAGDAALPSGLAKVLPLKEQAS